MYRFYVNEEQIEENNIVITGSDVNHIKNVLRLEKGDWIIACDGNGRDYVSRIGEISSDSVVLNVEKEQSSDTELDCRIVLFQGLPKKDKMEFIIQKAVELGVYKIVPVSMKNCVVKLDEKKAAKKVERWQAIAESAAKQSKRTIIPLIDKPVSYKLALEKAGKLDVTLVPYENERGMAATRQIMGQIKKGQSIGIVIGPEGGFAPEEIKLADDNDMHRISLGRRILRTETAGLATLAMLVFNLDS